MMEYVFPHNLVILKGSKIFSIRLDLMHNGSPSQCYWCEDNPEELARSYRGVRSNYSRLESQREKESGIYDIIR